MPLPDIEAIKVARKRTVSSLRQTPIMHSSTLNRLLGADIILKAENFQTTGSFKPQGALNALLCLPDTARRKGVIAVSAGNHGAAVAWTAKQSGVSATIVMPSTAAKTKIAAVMSYGAELKLAGQSTIGAFQEMERLKTERGLTLIHPFEDPNVIAGAGTLALELMEQAPDLDCVLVPIGGGCRIGSQYVSR